MTVSETRFLVKTRQSGSPELRPYCKQSVMKSISDWKKETEKEYKMDLEPKSKSKIFNCFDQSISKAVLGQINDLL